MEISSFFRIIKLQVIFHRFSTFDHVGGYVQISDNKSTKLKKIPILISIYKCMSLYFILLNRSVSVTLSSLTLPENKKLRNYVTVREKNKIHTVGVIDIFCVKFGPIHKKTNQIVALNHITGGFYCLGIQQKPFPKFDGYLTLVFISFDGRISKL